MRRCGKRRRVSDPSGRCIQSHSGYRHSSCRTTAALGFMYAIDFDPALAGQRGRRALAIGRANESPLGRNGKYGRFQCRRRRCIGRAANRHQAHQRAGRLRWNWCLHGMNMLSILVMHPCDKPKCFRQVGPALWQHPYVRFQRHVRCRARNIEDSFQQRRSVRVGRREIPGDGDSADYPLGGNGRRFGMEAEIPAEVHAEQFLAIGNPNSNARGEVWTFSVIPARAGIAWKRRARIGWLGASSASQQGESN